MLCQIECSTGGQFAEAGLFCRHIQIRCIDHCGHRLRTEVVLFAAVVPQNPEVIAVGNLIADTLAAGGVGHQYSAERLAPIGQLAGGVHVVVHDPLYRTGGTVQVCLIVVVQRQDLSGRQAAFVQCPLFQYRHLQANVFFSGSVYKGGRNGGVGCYRNRQLLRGLVGNGELVLQTVFAQHEEKVRCEPQRHVLEERILLVVHIRSPQPCTFLIGGICHNVVLPLMKETVDMVVERSRFVYRQLIGRIRGFQHAVCKTVRQVQRRQTPDFRRLPDVLRCVVLVPAEKFHAVGIVVKPQHVRTDSRCDQCGIAAGTKLNAFHTLPVDFCCCVLHNMFLSGIPVHRRIPAIFWAF